ncbi:MAG: CBS domain-containing protein [Pseudohongiellaceae bacterium]
MDTRINTFATRDLVCVDMEATVAELVGTLAKVKLTAVPVLDSNGNCFGIVSALDILSLMADGGNIDAIKAWEICSHAIIYVEPNITTAQACQVMHENRVHHLVLGNAKDPVGIVSTMDIVERLDGEARAHLIKRMKKDRQV